jgi:hypothetical protein
MSNNVEFNWDRPCTLDTIVFAQLALHLYPSLIHPTLSLRIHLNFPSLVDFVNRMKEKVAHLPLIQPIPKTFWQELKEMPHEFYQSLPSWSAIQVFSSNPNVRNEQIQRILAMIAGLTVFVGYVFSSGLIQIEWSEEEE